MMWDEMRWESLEVGGCVGGLLSGGWGWVMVDGDDGWQLVEVSGSEWLVGGRWAVDGR